MTTRLGKNEKAAFEIANLLDDAADAIRERSKRAYAAGRMSLEEYADARAREMELRSELSVIVATDLSSALENASTARENIEQAILEAKMRIESVKSVKKGLEVVASLVSLAGALASGDAKRVLEVGRTVTKLNSGPYRRSE